MPLTAVRTFIKTWIFAVLIPAAANNAAAQVTEALLEQQFNERREEKLYVQFDKPVYYAGETIWFKAHIFAGFQPSRISTVLYTELLDSSGRVLERKTWPVVKSSAAGDMTIPADMASQPVLFRAYTRWMLNFDEGFIFRRQLAVTGKDAAASSVPKNIRPYTVSLRFFPEGGDLVTGVESRLAFEAVGNDGKPAVVSGKIVDADNNTIAAFATQHDGMGSCMLKPAPGKTYHAVAAYAGGGSTKVRLPEARTDGVVMRLVQDASGETVYITRSAQNSTQYDTLQMLVMLQQELLIGRLLVFKPGEYQLQEKLDLEDLPASAVTITLFSKQWEPVAERVFFKHSDNYKFSATLRTLETGTGKRGRNRVEITVNDTMPANLSIAVIDGRYMQAASQHNIYSGLLLNGDIKGAIYNPAQYFSTPYGKMAPQLDLVMLTHGWRRYNWRQMMDYNQPLPRYRPDDLLTVEAVINVNGRKDTSGLTGFYLAYRNADSTVGNILLTPSGEARYANPGMVFYDSLEVTPFPLFKKKKRYKSDIELGSDLLKQPPAVAGTATAVPDSMALQQLLEIARSDARFGGSSKYKPLERVIVKGRARGKQEELDDKYAGGLFSGGAVRIIDFTDPSNLIAGDFWSYVMREAPVGVAVNSQDSVEWRGITTDLFLDEMPVNLQDLRTLNLSEVAYVKFFKPPFLGAFGGGPGGAIAVYTRRGRDGDWRNSNANRKFFLQGFSRMKEFYSPVYPATGAMDDTRTTLYWNPYILLNKKTPKATIEFYNNDFSTSLFIVVEGVLASGRLVRIEKLVQ